MTRLYIMLISLSLFTSSSLYTKQIAPEVLAYLNLRQQVSENLNAALQAAHAVKVDHRMSQETLQVIADAKKAIAALSISTCHFYAIMLHRSPETIENLHALSTIINTPYKWNAMVHEYERKYHKDPASIKPDYSDRIMMK